MSSIYDGNRWEVQILRHIDADTTEVLLDQGFEHTQRMTIRWEGINAPELHTPEGKKALTYVRSALPEGSQAVITTRRDGRVKEKFGRYLATFWVGDLNVNKQLIEDGFAVPYMVEK